MFDIVLHLFCLHMMLAGKATTAKIAYGITRNKLSRIYIVFKTDVKE